MNPVDAAIAALATVVDPEVGESLVDMGLVYAVEPQAAGLLVRLGVTSAACPMRELIEAQARAALAQALPGVAVRVESVLEPAWTPARMSAAARQRLGWDGA